MVARINTSKSISKALNYNEQKVVNEKLNVSLGHVLLRRKCDD
jgi:hypothetical protein